VKINTIGIVRIAMINIKVIPILSIDSKIDSTNNTNVNPAKNPRKKPTITLNELFKKIT